jgi:hypothetical protein
MGRPSKSKAAAAAAENTHIAKPPMMKYAEAVKLADKNSRTMMKISQLMVPCIFDICSLDLVDRVQ